MRLHDGVGLRFGRAGLLERDLQLHVQRVAALPDRVLLERDVGNVSVGDGAERMRRKWDAVRELRRRRKRPGVSRERGMRMQSGVGLPLGQGVQHDDAHVHCHVWSERALQRGMLLR